jgi:prophage regulatory protein
MQDTTIKSRAEELLPIARSTRLLRLPEVIARVGLKRSTIYKRMGEGTFPKPKKIGQRSVAWSETDIDLWINEVMA